MSEMARAENEISTAWAHAARLLDEGDKLAQHYTNLQNLVDTYRGVLSTLRRLPNEILLEIFQHTFTHLDNLDTFGNAPWLVIQVCRHWRAVALASPGFWSHFIIPGGENLQSLLMATAFPAQVERVRGGPISIYFAADPSPHVLAMFLPLSSQWDNISLDTSLFMSPPLSDHVFPALRRLTLYYLGPEPREVCRNDAMPALEDLVLNLYDCGLPKAVKSSIPWSQMQKCALRDLDSADFLWIVAQLPHAKVVIRIGNNLEAPDASLMATTSVIRSLIFAHCSRNFVSDVLTSLSTPALDEFVLSDTRDTFADYPLGERVVQFLDRSGCTLKHLRFNLHLEEQDLIAILGSPHIHSVIHLNFPRTVLPPRALAALAVPLPNLCRLTLGGALDEGLLLAALSTYNYPTILPLDGNLQLGELQVILTGRS
ncbi:hypothetical protein B0H16DRAFT_1834562 [Mycena metata]|uniref:F-box domain-containing protein n=1 Tax=Mycena metata TaxID=1033252 RepID=A0AAD7NAD4_9AGAR|nr:hypothetical protein B0H16DRAFT_1834562 [Mycena metata]